MKRVMARRKRMVTKKNRRKRIDSSTKIETKKTIAEARRRALADKRDKMRAEHKLNQKRLAAEREAKREEKYLKRTIDNVVSNEHQPEGNKTKVL